MVIPHDWLLAQPSASVKGVCESGAQMNEVQLEAAASAVRDVHHKTPCLVVQLGPVLFSEKLLTMFHVGQSWDFDPKASQLD